MYKKYKSEFDYSYALGIAPTLDLVKFQPRAVKEVYLHSSGEDSEGVEQLRDLCVENQVYSLIDDKAIARLSLKENVHAIGIFKKYKTTLAAGTNHVVLVNPSDMGNLGTIIRTMVSFGLHDLAIIGQAADIFHPKVIRATMGALFQINFEHFDTFQDYAAKFPRQYYPFMLDAAKPLAEVEFSKPCSLVFGNESSGLDSTFARIGQPVFIEQTKNTDSLNLGVAVAIGLYKLSHS
jgi:TrmH family RNA methyltransferase